MAIDCKFYTSFGLRTGNRVANVAIGGAASAVTLSCATPGARITYTTDESYPQPGNPAATTYTAPFAVTAGTKVRAGATAAGMKPSDTAIGQF